MLAVLIGSVNYAVAENALESTEVDKLVKQLDRHVDDGFFLTKMAGTRVLIELYLGSDTSKADSDVKSNIAKATTEIKADYKKIKPLIESNPSTVNVLNDFVASAISDIESLKVGYNETERSYESRVAQIERELKKKRNLLLLQF